MLPTDPWASDPAYLEQWEILFNPPGTSALEHLCARFAAIDRMREIEEAHILKAVSVIP